MSYFSVQRKYYFLPFILFLVLITLFSFFRYNLNQQETQRREALAKAVAQQVANTLEVFSADRIRALNDLVLSWPDRHPNPIDWFHTHAASMKNVLPGIADIWWVDKEFKIKWAVAAKQKANLLGRSLVEFGVNIDELASTSHTTALLHDQQLFSLYIFRVDPNNQDLGYVLASFDIDTTLVVMMGDLIGPQFNFALYDGAVVLLQHGQMDSNTTVLSYPVVFADRIWQLKIQSPQQSMAMGDILFWTGLVMSFLVSLFLFWQLKSAFKLSTSQLYYQAASEAALDSILVYQAKAGVSDEIEDFELIDANNVAITMLDIAIPIPQSIRLSEQLRAIRGEQVLPDIIKVCQTGRAFETTLQTSSSNAYQWLKLQIVKAGNGVAMTIRDITQQQLYQQQLQHSEAKFRRLTDGLLGHFVYSISATGQVTYISSSVEQILGYDTIDFQQNYQKYVIDLPEKMADIRRRQLQGERAKPYTVSYLSAAQTEVFIEYSDSPVFDEKGNLIAIEGIGRDVTEDLKLREKIYYQANHDQLTGLLNRYAFDRKLKSMLDTMRSTSHKATLCYVDMDQFKLINDTCGHQAGDQLLHNIANILGQTLSKRDVLARIGGDEFCMILDNIVGKQAEAVIQTVLDNVAAFRFFWEDKVFHVGASVGLVHFGGESYDSVSLIKAADNACYKAKDNGRNQFYVYQQCDSEEQYRSQELRILGKLQNALEQNTLQLYFQTIKPLSGDSARHNYEILLRMFDEDGQMVSPGMFIPVAERHGLMSRVDNWVFDKTMALLESHPQHVAALDKCAINLSGASLNSPSLLNTMLQRLKRTSVPMQKLCFEITETAAVTNLVTAGSMIDEIRSLGCQFSLDDFGAGMSSFTYLKNMNVDYVKIDGSFVKNICQDKRDHATVRAIHEIAKSMGKKTIAEFVGDVATEHLLQDMGVDYAQGFGIAKPMPFLSLLEPEALE
jgi:diguanylate cyclase (GGDEF)-like protein/PAS domain S-box-containing protein